jgi:hypothetical protein
MPESAKVDHYRVRASLNIVIEMNCPRLPRFKRSPDVAPMQLTVRDHEIVRLVCRHRFLRSQQIIALIADNPQQLLRRLHLLYHHGYLERPRAQLDYYHQGGSRPIVYGLGSKGAATLKQELGKSFRQLRWGGKNGSVGRIFLEHALLISDVMVAIELACRQAGIRLLIDEKLPLQNAIRGKRQPWKWYVKVTSRLKLGIVPDRVFALEFPDRSGKPIRAFFFLEARRERQRISRFNRAEERQLRHQLRLRPQRHHSSGGYEDNRAC